MLSIAMRAHRCVARGRKGSAEQDQAPFCSPGSELPRLQQLLHEDLMGNDIKSLHTYIYMCMR